MVRRLAPLPLLLLLLIACTPDSPSRKQQGTPSEDSGPLSSPGTPTGPTTSPATGTPTSTGLNCDDLPAPPFTIVEHNIQTQEDFDFSAGGYLVYQEGIAVVGTDSAGNTSVLSAGAAGDPRGIHGLSDGRIVILSPWDGQIKIADPATGGLETIVSNLDIPNGVEVGADDRIYFTSLGEVGWVEVDGSNPQVLHDWGGFEEAPNGTALSEDEQRLYVAVPQVGATDFVTFERLGPDAWGPVTALYSVGGVFAAIDVDVCGNLYTVNYASGQVYRVTPDGQSELIAVLDGAGFAYSAMRFGPGHGGWERDSLYISSRADRVFEVQVGIPGRSHPTTP